MSNLIVKIFPVMAVLLSVFACFRPQELSNGSYRHYVAPG